MVRNSSDSHSGEAKMGIIKGRKYGNASQSLTFWKVRDKHHQQVKTQKHTRVTTHLLESHR
jgi:hypothetical protein